MALNLKASARKSSSVAEHKVRRPMPLIGHLSFERQFLLVGSIFVVSLAVTLAALYLKAQTNARGAAYISVSGQIRPLAHQIPKATQNALEGQDRGFRELRQARSQFALLIDHLVQGGESNGVTIPATTASPSPQQPSITIRSE